MGLSLLNRLQCLDIILLFFCCFFFVELAELQTVQVKSLQVNSLFGLTMFSSFQTGKKLSYGKEIRFIFYGSKTW